MFSSHRNLRKRTPAEGIERPEYIAHLVDEYYTTTNVEAQEQAEALDVFAASLESANPHLKLHGVAALCNICLDKSAAKFIREHLKLITDLFVRTDHPEIVLHSLTLFYQLLEAGEFDRELLLVPVVLRTVQEWRQKSDDLRIVQLCQLLLEDFATRSEIIELQNAATALPALEQPSTSRAAAGATD
ncbi:uncharacterized protein [Drosophila bipectinata]|uniref:uncharacterized protein isoform X2 n=1 Tax=Drosophila bipectinata TaxID=42026 RepID=UPI001C899EF7|nr:armadillo repeat-containing protein 7 isoform X2 [Drosophila bipectinata]